MSDQHKRYWVGLEDLTNEPEFVKNASSEFGPNQPNSGPVAHESMDELSSTRRDFLKLMGFSVAAASLAACEAPVRKAIPYLNKPEEIDPSIANWYASSYVDGGDYCAVLVKTREGRPIKLEGNNLSSISRGGTSARVQASVLSLYDTERFKGPKIKNASTDWATLDKAVIAGLGSAQNIRIVSQTVLSPLTKAAIAEFIAKYPSARHISYDPASASGILEANKASFGQAVLPAYRFDKAQIIVSFSADFLGTWISPTEYARQFSVNRKLSKKHKKMSRLYVFEPVLSLTGSNADVRKPVRASEEGSYLIALYNILAASLGASKLSGLPARPSKELDKAAADLLANKGASLVVCGSNNPDVQILTNAINNLLGNYGKTIDIGTPSYQKQGNDKEMNAFIDQVNQGAVDAVIFYGANPVYDHPRGGELKKSLSKVALKISFADRPDETTELADYTAPDHHYLESWGDAEPKKGFYSLIQPTIAPLFQTRQAQESLLSWAGKPTDTYTYLQAYWKKNIYSQQNHYRSFQQFWNYALHDGIFELHRPNLRKSVGAIPATASSNTATDTSANLNRTDGGEQSLANVDKASTSATEISASGNTNPSKAVKGAPLDMPFSNFNYNFGADLNTAAVSVSRIYKPKTEGIDLVIYETIGMGSGSQANNPWLQEFPDPISRTCWENYVTISPTMASSDKFNLRVIEGKTLLAEVIVNNQKVTLPIIVQPGQAADTIGIAIGYGREVAGKAGKGIGKNAFPFIQTKNAHLDYFVSGASIKNTGSEYTVAQVQTHHTVMNRVSVIQETTLAAYQKDDKAGRFEAMVSTAEGKKPANQISVWDMHTRPNHAWGMMIDLTSCIGCGACVVACNAENNVPVVGKQEVINRREMHWLRIDRYYSSVAAADDLKGLENASDNPEVVFQPVMCQHCNNAPCETVCPVAATTHSTEGLNQMTYNRCIGTRYCANNCPYKVRRFNWFSYVQNADNFPDNPANSDLGRMVLNPDVTVRARGVMEKCSMCVQRIQEGKLTAKKEGRRPIDGEIVTACSQSCPTEGIVFGDMNDPSSAISELIAQETEGRAYYMLSEINTRPSVGYLVKVRNNNGSHNQNV